MAKELYEFGPFQLDPSGRRLLRREEPVAITPKALDTLTALVLHREQPLNRQDLIAKIWPDTVVGEHNLNQCIAVLRKALDDDPRRPDYIATLPGRGYAFVAEVQVVTKPNGAERVDIPALSHEPALPSPLLYSLPSPLRPDRWRVALFAVAFTILAGGVVWYFVRHADSASAARRAAKARRSVAVLGMKNLTDRPDAAWLSLALPEMLTTELGAGGVLRTIPEEEVARNRAEWKLEATSPPPEALERVHRGLGADFVITGGYTVLHPSERNTGEQVRLDLRIQNAATGESVASTSQEGDLRDLFLLVSRSGAELRNDLGGEAVSAAEASQSRAAVASNVQAERFYVAGLERLRTFDVSEARTLLEKSVASDPSFPMAHLALADAWRSMGYPANEAAEAKRAWELATSLSRENQLLIEARYQRTIPNWDKAIGDYRSLATFFPDNLDYSLGLADAQTRAGKAHDALATVGGLRKSSAPAADDPRLDMAEAQAYGALSDYRQAAAAAGRAAEKARARGSRWQAANALLFEAGALGSAGDAAKAGPVGEQARAICHELENRPCLAVIYRWRGISQVESNPDEASRNFDAALAIARETGNQTEEGNDLNGLAVVASERGDYRTADRMYDDLLELARLRDDKWGIQMSLNNLGDDLRLEGRLDEARKAEEEAVAVSRTSGQKIGIADGLASLAQILELQGDLASAERDYKEALEVLRSVSDEDTSAPLVAGLAEVLRDRDDLAGARSKHEAALQFVSHRQDAAATAAEQMSLARLCLDENRPADAARLARQAADEFADQKRGDDEALARALLAKALSGLGQNKEARMALDRAAHLVSKSQALLTRLQVEIVEADSNAALDHSSRSVSASEMRHLQTIAHEAHGRGILSLEFEARLAEGQWQECGRGGSRTLMALQKEALAKGFLLIANRAARPCTSASTAASSQPL
jgi:eukaryotic-like serine/threonine-protein kinase